MKSISLRLLYFCLALIMLNDCSYSSDSEYGTIKEVVNRFTNAKNRKLFVKIVVYPSKIGPYNKTLNNKIVINDSNIIDDIVNLIVFTDTPIMPKKMHHAGENSGCILHFETSDNHGFNVFVLFCKGPAGHGVDYKISKGPMVLSRDDPNLPGNNILGHGYSVPLFDVLQNALIISSNNKLRWVKSHW